MFIHQPLGAFDLTGKQGVSTACQRREGALPLDVFVIGAQDPAAIMAEYAKITGLPEMPPLWSFGYQQSHRTLAAPEEILQEAKTFREKKLPCDTMIYLGTDFCPTGWNTHNGEFTWNPKAFPDPKAMIDELHDAAFKVVLHIVIEGRQADRHGHDPCTRRAAAERPHTRTASWPRRPPGQLLLAGAQAAARCRHRRLVARPGRRPRCAVAAGAQPDVLRRPRRCTGPTSASYRAASQRLRRACSATRRSCGRATCSPRGRR